MDLREIDILGDAIGSHWYYRSKLAALRRFLGPTRRRALLDIGAGSGFFARALLESGMVAEATCVDPFYDAERDEMLEGRRLAFRRAASSDGFDLLLLMDVLEHVEDDVGLLREYVRNAPPGAEFVISVPAFRWLWSGHDVFLGHHRRYTLREVDALVRVAGLRPVKSSYYFGLVLPLAVLARLPDLLRRALGRPVSARNGLRRSGAVVNSLLFAACAAELPALRFNTFAGLTCFALARKPEEDMEGRNIQ